MRLPQVELPPAVALPDELVPAAKRIREEAEQIAAKRVDYLGSGLTPLGPEIDWQRDFKSGYRWPPAFYQDLEITRLDDDSDAKVPWELSRGHQLLTLALAARLHEDRRFAEELEDQLDDWMSGNPPGVGINWTNPMEVGIRAVNWLWAIALLEATFPLRSPLRERVANNLAAHGRHIRANLEESPVLRSNHYLGDILGLLAIGYALPEDAAAQRWFDYAHENFEREIHSQVLPDGAGFEASVAYHGLVMEMFVLARHLAADAGRPFSSAYDDRMRSMLGLARAIRHPDGRAPQFGDADSGRILPAGFGRGPTLDHVIWLAAAELDAPRPLPGAAHEEVAWTLGVDRWKDAGGAPEADEPPRAFPHGGLYVLGDDLTHLVVRCGDVGQAGNGGHAHNDALSFEFSYREPLVVDSGTYAYTSDPASRDWFRSTAAHSTVRVDRAEINPIRSEEGGTGELFSLRQRATVTVEEVETEGRVHRLTATHDGYSRLPGGPLIRRSFVLDVDSGELRVEDEISGSGEHLLESFIHLSAHVTPARAGDGIDLLVGEERVATIAGSDTTSFEIEEGWVSDGFGVRSRAAVLVARRTANLPARMAYSIAMAKVPRAASTPPALSGA